MLEHGSDRRRERERTDRTRERVDRKHGKKIGEGREERLDKARERRERKRMDGSWKKRKRERESSQSI